MSNDLVMDRPSHIAADKVVDFDFYADLSCADPHALAARLAREHPVFWTPRNGGHWVLAGHRELFDASRNTEVFSSTSQSIPRIEEEVHLHPINDDPPQHAVYREPLGKAFSPQRMMALQDEIRALAVELIEKVRNHGHCDFARDIAEPLPVLIFMKVMGLPLDEMPRYRQWVLDIINTPDMTVRANAVQQSLAAMMAIVEDRKRERRNDLISVLLDEKIAGRPVTDDEMRGYCLLLMIGGLDTVMNGMCYGIRHLASHPDLQAQLRADPSRIPDAMEEILRRYTFTLPGRRIAKDHEAFGVTFKKDERVMLMLSAGDLDPREFDKPEVFNMERENNPHMAFYTGVHRCVGSHLARVELRVLYEEMLARLPDFRLDPEHPPQIMGGRVVGFRSLPLVWDA